MTRAPLLGQAAIRLRNPETRLQPQQSTPRLSSPRERNRPIRLTGPLGSRTIPRHHRRETRMPSLLKALGAALLALVLVSCKTPPDRQQFPDITFQHLQPFRLDVAKVEIVDGYQADPVNDIGSQFPELPAAVA